MNGPRRAISLIELTLVILIIGITAAIATPRLAESVRAVNLRAATIRLASHIDYLRSVAVNESRTVTLVFDNSQQSYGSPDVDFPQRPGERLSVSLTSDYDAAFQLTANFDNRTELTFDFEGIPRVENSPLQSGSVTLHCGGDGFRVLIASGSGETRIERLSSSAAEQAAAASL